MTIKTPEDICKEQQPLVTALMLRIEEALVKGARQFFTTNVYSDHSYDIPFGYLSAVKASLEKSSWVVAVQGTKDHPFLRVYSPKEANGYHS